MIVIIVWIILLYLILLKRFNTRRKKANPIKMSPTNHKNPLTQIDMNIIYLMILSKINMISECTRIWIIYFREIQSFQFHELLQYMNVSEILIWNQLCSSRDESYISICLESLDATLFMSSKGWFLMRQWEVN